MELVKACINYAFGFRRRGRKHLFESRGFFALGESTKFELAETEKHNHLLTWGRPGRRPPKLSKGAR
ncbi:Hypothetical predicted protein [Cloeon dipterum]|uniref:Uncharacterized protein n=1 Tax=Cloeon dipterum TaxID=197152 RepID=A0A8S1DG29_9INSE|nr:Hypothetical predicted protein [Cloeon dipterum]